LDKTDLHTTDFLLISKPRRSRKPRNKIYDLHLVFRHARKPTVGLIKQFISSGRLAVTTHVKSRETKADFYTIWCWKIWRKISNLF